MLHCGRIVVRVACGVGRIMPPAAAVSAEPLATYFFFLFFLRGGGLFNRARVRS